MNNVKIWVATGISLREVFKELSARPVQQALKPCPRVTVANGDIILGRNGAIALLYLIAKLRNEDQIQRAIYSDSPISGQSMVVPCRVVYEKPNNKYAIWAAFMGPLEFNLDDDLDIRRHQYQIFIPGVDGYTGSANFEDYCVTGLEAAGIKMRRDFWVELFPEEQ